MTVRMRHTRSHTRNRRAHHALENKRFSACEKCGATRVRHIACPNCGTYRKREVVDMNAVQERKLARKNNKLKTMGKEVEAKADTKATNKTASEDKTPTEKKVTK